MEELYKPKLLFGRRSKILFWVITILILVFLFSPWISFTLGNGRVTSIDPNERVQSLSAPIDGFIHQWYVKEGQLIKAGEVIVDLTDNDPEIISRLETQRDAAKQSFESAKVVKETAEIDYNRQLSLFEQGLSSRKEFEDSKIKYNEALVKELDKQASFAKMETSLARQYSQRIVAPRDGVVTRILPGEKGQLIKKGSPVVIFTPETKTPAIELWIDGNDVAMVQKDQEVMVQFEGWPSVQIPGWPALAIGAFKGVVYLVDQASTVDGKFRVLVVPNGRRWPSQNLLRQGMKSRGYIKIRNSFVLREIWRVLNGYPALGKPIEDEINLILGSGSSAEKGK